MGCYTEPVSGSMMSQMLPRVPLPELLFLRAGACEVWPAERNKQPQKNIMEPIRGLGPEKKKKKSTYTIT